MQESGRGRQGRSWVSEAGNFFGSTLVVLKTGDPGPASLSLAAGLALVETVDVAAPGQPLMLKWPNDLLLAGRKMAGILLERSEDRIVVGFGVNLASAPELGDREAAALRGTISPEAFAPLLAGCFARMLDLWRGSDPAALAQAWLARAHPVGTELTVHVAADQKLSGRFAGIELDGALRLETPRGLEVVRAGDVSL